MAACTSFCVNSGISFISPSPSTLFLYTCSHLRVLRCHTDRLHVACCEILQSRSQVLSLMWSPPLFILYLWYEYPFLRRFNVRNVLVPLIHLLIFLLTFFICSLSSFLLFLLSSMRALISSSSSSTWSFLLFCDLSMSPSFFVFFVAGAASLATWVLSVPTLFFFRVRLPLLQVLLLRLLHVLLLLRIPWLLLDLFLDDLL